MKATRMNAATTVRGSNGRGNSSFPCLARPVGQVDLEHRRLMFNSLDWQIQCLSLFEYLDLI